jgi:predicted NAD/FAD-binding protein
MDDLQSLSTDKRSHLFTTLNVFSPPDSAHILGRYAYSHPVFSSDAVHAQHALAQLNARIMESGWHRAFAGVWACYGFHKDSFALPFAITDADVEQASWASSSKVAHVFDVLDAVRACAALLVGGILLGLISSPTRPHTSAAARFRWRWSPVAPVHCTHSVAW